MRKNKIYLVILCSVIFILVLVFKSAPPSPLYFLKISRENLQSIFIFGTEDKANWYLTLADKRLSESEKLKNMKMNYLAKIQFNAALDYQKKAEDLIKELKDKTNTTYLEEKALKNQDQIRKIESGNF